jgi:prepilin-type N-terminal cleavage/methylation domain-containing protein
MTPRLFRPRRAAGQAGVTLLEVLIAVSLLSLLTVGILYTMRLALGALAKTNQRLIANRRVVGAQNILQQQLLGFIPAMAACGTGGGPGQGNRTQFFYGTETSMRFVTAYSLEESLRGTPKIVELLVIPGDNSEGVRLVMNESLYSGPLSAGAFCPQSPAMLPVALGPRAFVLADKLSYCRFLYQYPAPGPAKFAWMPLTRPERWPWAVRVEMAPLGEGDSRLRPLTVTAPLRITRYPVFDYVDR